MLLFSLYCYDCLHDGVLARLQHDFMRSWYYCPMCFYKINDEELYLILERCKQ